MRDDELHLTENSRSDDDRVGQAQTRTRVDPPGPVGHREIHRHELDDVRGPHIVQEDPATVLVFLGEVPDANLARTDGREQRSESLRVGEFENSRALRMFGFVRTLGPDDHGRVNDDYRSTHRAASSGTSRPGRTRAPGGERGLPGPLWGPCGGGPDPLRSRRRVGRLCGRPASRGAPSGP